MTTNAHDAHAFWNDVPWPPLDLTIAPADGEWPTPAARLLQITFNGATHHDQPVRIFGLCALHPDPARHPTVLLLHGGGGYARSPFSSRRLPYFTAGYNVLSIDMPGKGEQRDESRSTGPDMDGPTMCLTGRDGYLYHAVQACRRAFDAAAALGCTHPSLSIEGWSWGAVVGLLTAAADPRLTNIVAMYGAGHLFRGGVSSGVRALPPDVQSVWRHQFDPAWQTYPSHPHVYLVTASNDLYFALPDNLATLARLAPASAHLAIIPNANHECTAPFMRSVDLWLGARAAATTPTAASVSAIRNHGEQLDLHLTGARQADVAVAEIADPAAAKWPQVLWALHALPVRDDHVRLPAAAVADNLWFANLHTPAGFITSTGLYRGSRQIEIPSPWTQLCAP